VAVVFWLVGSVNWAWFAAEARQFSSCVKQMARQPRSPRAFQVKGGRWFRPPKPRPRLIARLRSPIEENNKESRPIARSDEEEDTGYDTCEEKIRGDVTAALVAAAFPVIKYLRESGDFGGANIVHSLCERLEKKEEMVKRIRRGLQKTREQRDTAQAQVQAQGDLQGQSARHWHQAKKLKGQVDWAMQLNLLLRRRLWGNGHRVPYIHPP